MSYIAFIPGLEGNKSLAARTDILTPGTYAHAVSDVARELELPFYRIDFQTSANPFPRLSDMGREAASQIGLLNWQHRGRGLIVASSIGAGVALQALLNLKEDGSQLPYVMLFKPGIDPIDLISQRMTAAGAGQYVDMLKAGKIPELGIPVDPSPASPDPGKFILTPAHVNDADALRLVTEDKSRAFFYDSFQETKIPQLHVVTSADDPMFTAQIADMFARVAQPCTDYYELVLLPGKRADDHGPGLQQQIRRWAHGRSVN